MGPSNQPFKSNFTKRWECQLPSIPQSWQCPACFAGRSLPLDSLLEEGYCRRRIQTQPLGDEGSAPASWRTGHLPSPPRDTHTDQLRGSAGHTLGVSLFHPSLQGWHCEIPHFSMFTLSKPQESRGTEHPRSLQLSSTKSSSRRTAGLAKQVPVID